MMIDNANDALPLCVLGKPMNLAFDSGRKGPGFGRLPPTGPKAASLINRIASAPLIDRVAR